MFEGRKKTIIMVVVIVLFAANFWVRFSNNAVIVNQNSPSGQQHGSVNALLNVPEWLQHKVNDSDTGQDMLPGRIYQNIFSEKVESASAKAEVEVEQVEVVEYFDPEPVRDVSTQSISLKSSAFEVLAINYDQDNRSSAMLKKENRIQTVFVGDLAFGAYVVTKITEEIVYVDSLH